jgi:hypothetical protein
MATSHSKNHVSPTQYRIDNSSEKIFFGEILLTELPIGEHFCIQRFALAAQHCRRMLTQTAGGFIIDLADYQRIVMTDHGVPAKGIVGGLPADPAHVECEHPESNQHSGNAAQIAGGALETEEEE